MVYQRNWYNPYVVKRVRTGINIILVIIAALVLYMNHAWLLNLVKNIIKN